MLKVNDRVLIKGLYHGVIKKEVNSQIVVVSYLRNGTPYLERVSVHDVKELPHG